MDLSALNLSYTGGNNPTDALNYVTIDSCKTFIEQTTFWYYCYAILFIIFFSLFIYYYIKYHKLYKSQ